MFNPCDAIRTRIGLASLYCQWARYSDALSAVEEALVIVDRERASSTNVIELQEMLGEILVVKGRVCLERDRKKREQAQTVSTSLSKEGGCCQALSLFEEALGVHRSLTAQEGLADEVVQETRTADVLLDIFEAKMCLERFDEAREALKEALEIRSCIFGEDSIAAAVCLCKIADSYGEQAHAQLRDMQSGDVQVSLEHWQSPRESNRLRVLRYRSLSTYTYPRVLDARIFVEVEQGRSKERSHDFFTHTTVACPDECTTGDEPQTYTTQVEKKPTRRTVRHLKDQQLLYCQMALRSLLKVFGVQGELKATDCRRSNECYGLRRGYLPVADGAAVHLDCSQKREAETRESKTEVAENDVAVSHAAKVTEDNAVIETARKALRIHQRVWGGDDPRIARYLENLEKSLPAMSRLNAPGVFIADVAHKKAMVSALSSDDDEGNLGKLCQHIERIRNRLSLPGLRRPAARQEDEEAMVQMLASLDAFNGGTGRLSSVSGAARMSASKENHVMTCLWICPGAIAGSSAKMRPRIFGLALRSSEFLGCLCGRGNLCAEGCSPEAALSTRIPLASYLNANVPCFVETG